MLRKFAAVALIGLMASAPVFADSGQSSPSKSRSGGKRVMWTIVGAAAGFGAGVYLGLNKFDDAINSDRKVWTTAIAGAAAGGVAGALISKNIGRAPHPGEVALARPSSAMPTISWDQVKRGATAPALPR